MNEKKVVLIGKIGKCIKFSNFDINTGGDAPIIFYSSISRMNPNWDFYFIGPNDIKKMTKEQYEYLFPNKNVFSAFSRDNNTFELYEGIPKFFEDNNIVPDFGLFFNGMCGSSNRKNFNRKPDGTYCQILESFVGYAGPYIYTLDKLGTPFYLLSEDPRYITINARDLYNRERLVFSQTNGVFETAKHAKSETDPTTTTTKVNCIYSGIEKIFMMGLPADWKERIDIDRKLKSTHNKFIVLSNGHGCKKINHPDTNATRFDGYNEWILKNFKDTEYADTKIYGKWKDEYYEKYPQIEDKKLIDLQDEIANAKYSFVYSIIPGFVTVKAWEMITIGLLPFLHPEYDKDNLLKLPEFLYVKTPKELVERARYLDEHPDEYVALLNECVNRIRPSWLNGAALNNFLFGKIGEDLGFTYEKQQGVDSILDRFKKTIF